MGIDAQNVRPTLSFGQAISNCFSKYATFKGRARRSEYWWFALLMGIIGLIANVIQYYALFEMGLTIDQAQIVSIFPAIVYLVFFIPSLAVLWRRLHDTGHSGWCWLLSLIPIIGFIILLVWCCQDSDPMSNKYGPSPKYQ